jgi:hypothetical protein
VAFISTLFNKTMILLYTLAILLFPLIIALNMLIYRLIVKKALKKYIEPKLTQRGLLFIDYKWPGLFSSGDFKDQALTITIMNKNGNIFNSVYTYVYYKESNETKKITARIDTIFWFIKKVTYSSDL